MGHISPNIALIPDLKKHFSEIHYIGSENGLEKDVILSQFTSDPTIYYHEIPSVKFDRTSPLKNIKIPFVLSKSIKRAKKLLKQIKPSVVFSKGGYVSVPVVLASSKLKIPVVIHESDLSMGIANKVASKHATTICTTFPETAKAHKNGVWTGSPANSNLIFANAQDAIKQYKLKSSLPTICVTGGSLGSKMINDAIEHILPSLALKYNIIHITGKGKKVNFSAPNYHQEEFTNNIGSIFKASDLIISRAGSNTIFELALLKKPMLLIPLSKKASRGDQIENANYFNRLHIATVLNEEDIDKLEQTIESCMKKRQDCILQLSKLNFSNGKTKLLNEILKAQSKKDS